MDVYYCPHKSRKSEASFVEKFQIDFPTANWIEVRFEIDESFLKKPVSREKLLSALNKDNLLSPNKKNKCIEALERCPEFIKVAENPNDLSFDLIIKDKDSIFYFEYHEEQHRQLKDSRDKAIFNAKNDEKIYVPRCLQRLIRDVWRLENFRPFSIIWKDWFEQNTYIPQLQAGFKEYHLPNKFSFFYFYKQYLDGN